MATSTGERSTKPSPSTYSSESVLTFSQALNRLLCGLLAALWMFPYRAGAEEPVTFAEWVKAPILPKNFLYNCAGSASGDATTFGSRIHLFRMPCGLSNDPLGTDSDADGMVDPNDPATIAMGCADTAPGNRLGLVLGPDNPYFDLRAPGDPGGIGYYRMNTQYQLAGSALSNLSMNLRAATPAGIASDGVTGGPTILNPTISYSHELENGSGIQSFVGKNLMARAGWTENLERSVRYGCAVYSPVPGIEATSGSAVHFFVEALGRSRLDDGSTARPLSPGEILPGLHWRVGENWWMSGAFIVPLGPNRFDSGLWHITCSWKF